MTENQIPYEQEEEINLVSLLFTVLHKYRQMAAAALVCAVLFAGVAVAKDLSWNAAVQKAAEEGDPTPRTSAQQTYEEDMVEYREAQNQHDTDVQDYNQQLRDNERSQQTVQFNIDNAEEYIEKSVLNSIDPYNVYNARADLYVTTDYKILPGMDYQNPDYTSSILSAYTSLLTNHEAISRYGKDAEVVFQSHNWPHWGNDVVNDYMVNTAAVYKYINDQTLTYINQGYTSDEISSMIELPEALNRIWYTRPYYGTVAHNAKAVYQKFMGWYDSNPVHLNPLAPSDSAKKWVEYLGDVDKALQMAKADFDKGEYQWVAEITNAIVFADPTNTDARLLCADAMEQLGYQAESGPWRNEYLTAAQELRHGNANLTAAAKNTGEMVKALSAPMLFDYMAIVMDKQALADEDFTVNVTLPDVGERHMLRVKNGVLLVYKNTLSDSADVSVTCPKNALFAILTNNQETVAKAVQIEGRAELLTRMMENMNQFQITGTNPFNIIEP